MILPASSPPAISQAVGALRAGQAVVIPTDTVYGLAVAASVAGATARLFVAKERPPDAALAVLVADHSQALRLADDLPPAAQRLVERWWPGPLTVVVRRSAASGSFELGGDGSTIGLRCPDHDLVRDLAHQVGPLVTTSANRHRQPTPATAQAVADALAGKVELVIDGGRCDGAPSTVVDCTGAEPRPLREGRIPWSEIVRTIENGGRP
ncbi:MAG: threonylcarbamoyl-AMP synthase [Actinobacteria bacterium]|nr:threonylcarbamoyl-AMP synthase [Actinomycetota bacterium]MBW3649098.1 threonylcarbamoyl-AMP synthase [Actinomycetota bacterium]